MENTVKIMKLSQLRPAPYNPRQISDKALAGLTESLREFGLTQPIVWNRRTKWVVSGHQRIKALQRLGKKEAPVMVVDWPEEKERAANLAHNNKAIEGEFTAEADSILKQIEEKDADLFKRLLLDEITVPEAADETKKGLDDTPTVGGDTRRNTGEVWELGRHRLICGSATDPAAVEKLMAGRKAQCVFTDPPYGVCYEAASGKFTKIKGDDQTGDKLALELLAPALRLAVASAKDDAAFYIWHASGTREDFAYAMKQAGLQERQYLIWAKPAAVLGWGDYQWAHEPCFYAGRAGQEVAFHGDRKQSTIWRVGRRTENLESYALGPGIILRDGDGGAVTIMPGESARKLNTIRIVGKNTINIQVNSSAVDLWEVSRDGKADHPTQKPVELAIRAIRNSTEEGDLVYDPFLGSGTTIVGAEVTDRRTAGCELERKYCTVIIDRWEKLTGQKAKKC